MSRKTLASATALVKSPVHEITGAKPEKGDLYGIEFENELEENDRISVAHQAQIAETGFSVSQDGSLRGAGFEFVSKPRPLDELKGEVEVLCGILKQYNWSYSRRTSTHIHINFADKTIPELLKFLALYYTVEPVLLQDVKNYRKDNCFAVPSAATRNMLVTNISRDFQLGKELAAEDIWKYASLNLATLFRIGTAECRIFHSSFDAKEVKRWLDALDSVLQTSKKAESLSELRAKFIAKEPQDYLRDVFGYRLGGHYWGLGDAAVALRRGFRDALPIYRLQKTFGDIESFLAVEEVEEQKRLARLLEYLKRDVDVTKYIEGANFQVVGAVAANPPVQPVVEERPVLMPEPRPWNAVPEPPIADLWQPRGVGVAEPQPEVVEEEQPDVDWAAVDAVLEAAAPDFDEDRDDEELDDNF